MKGGNELKSKFCFYILLLLAILIYPCQQILADDTTQYLVQASPEVCRHGLHAQPNGGPFSIFLFCDDGQGSNIGIILSEPGAGPGKIKLTGEKTWDSWYPNDRFWQEKQWATDVVSFLWSPSFEFLYVATSDIYGDGGLFKLNLKERKVERLLPNKSANYFKKIALGYSTKIERIDLERKKIIISIKDETGTSVAKEEIPFK
jgi:hypothetical protein